MDTYIDYFSRHWGRHKVWGQNSVSTGTRHKERLHGIKMSFIRQRKQSEKCTDIPQYERQSLQVSFPETCKDNRRGKRKLGQTAPHMAVYEMPRNNKGLLISYISSQIFIASQAHAYVYRTSKLLVRSLPNSKETGGKKPSLQRASWISFKEKWHSVVTISLVKQKSGGENKKKKSLL